MGILNQIMKSVFESNAGRIQWHSNMWYRLRCGATGEVLALPPNRNGNRCVFSEGRQ